MRGHLFTITEVDSDFMDPMNIYNSEVIIVGGFGVVAGLTSAVTELDTQTELFELYGVEILITPHLVQLH
jgi:hypothetical protein